MVHRTFHPVGQGAFYTEVFLGDNGSRFVMVYDCGTKTGVNDMDETLDAQIDIFKQSLGPDPRIDLLFLSHFHYDHICGLDRLLSGVKVGHTIIPMLTLPILTLTRVENFLQYTENALGIDQIISELYLGGGKSERFGNVLVVSPAGDGENVEPKRDILPLGKGTRINSGSVIPYKPFWEFIPFNSIEPTDPRVIDFMNELKEIPKAMNGDQLNVEGLIRGCRSKVRDLYRKVIGDADDNLYTLVVESRPVVGVIPKRNERYSHCLYFGDFDSQKNDSLWNRFSRIYNFNTIGTVQVPHHGSKDNWRKEMLCGDRRHYFISAGSTNTHHHPDFWVIKAIYDNEHCVKVVSEKKDSCIEDIFWVS